MAPLAGRRVLVTAGPTWVMLDAVRQLGNVSSGRTGVAVARAAVAAGAGVTLLLGPVPAGEGLEAPGASLCRFTTFDELYAEMESRLSRGGFDVLVHAAAVSDYAPVEPRADKLPSGKDELVLRLKPLPKIVEQVRRWHPGLFLVQFKLEAGGTEAELIERAAAARRRSGADLVVANDIRQYRDGLHPAVLIDGEGVVARAATTESLAECLVRETALRLTRETRG